MSRCFPFPPPGYELKEDWKLIIKEKHKSKKEKKDRCERKEKERGDDDDNHKKDKKRKREEHRDEKDKKKSKVSSSGENQNGLELVPGSKLTASISDERAVVKLGNRIRKDGATGIQMGRKITVVEKENASFMGKVQDNGVLAVKDKRDHGRIVNGHNLQLDSRILGNGVNRTKVEEGKERNGYRSIVGNEDKNKKAEDKKKEATWFRKDKVERETRNGDFLDFLCNIPSDVLKLNNDCHGKLPKLKEMNGSLHAKDSGVGRNKVGCPAVAPPRPAQSIPSRNTINSGVRKRAVPTDQKGSEKHSSPRSVIDNVRNIDSCHTTNSTKPENGRVDDILRNMASCYPTNNTKPENGRVKDISNRAMSNGVISPHILHTERKTRPCQASNGVATTKPTVNGCGDRRKAPTSHDIRNGAMSNGVIFPHKMRHIERKTGPCQASNGVATTKPTINGCGDGRKAPTSHDISNRAMSNGVISPHIRRIERKTGPCQASNGVAATKPTINGSGDGRKAPTSHPLVEIGGKTAMQTRKEPGATGSSSTSLKRKEKAIATMESPHPDLKYLSQLLTVPTLEPPPFDDQEWLFGPRGSETKRARLASPEIQCTKEVWSEAVRFTLDVIALPYVIPY